MCAKQAVIVIRHGEKDSKNGVHGDHYKNEKVNLPANNYYVKAQIRPDNGDTLTFNYTDLSHAGYNEGISFGETVPQLICNLQLSEIELAHVPKTWKTSSNANSYITAYPLLTKIVDNQPFTLNFYEDAPNITGELDLHNVKGSILVIGTAEILAEDGANQTCQDKSSPDMKEDACKGCDECKSSCDDQCNGKDSVLYYLNKQYGGKGTKLYRGKSIDVYTYEDGLQKFIQNPDDKTYKPVEL